MWLRDGEGTNARPQLMMGHLHTSPPHARYSAKIREQAEINHPGERVSGMRQGREGATESVCPLSLTGRRHPPTIATSLLEEAANSTALDTSPNPLT